MDDATLRCSICQVRDTEPVYPDATPLLRCHPLLRCRRCGLVFQSDAVSLEELDAAQAHAYGEPERRFAGPVERLVRIARWSRVRMAVRLLPPGGRVLDVGCGRGPFLRMLQERGYQVRGTELSPATAAQATSHVPNFASLRARLLRHSGFAVERLTTGHWEMDPFGLLQSGLNCLGLRPNGLYDTLRNHEAVPRDLGPATRLAGRAGALRVLARRSS